METRASTLVAVNNHVKFTGHAGAGRNRSCRRSLVAPQPEHLRGVALHPGGRTQIYPLMRDGEIVGGVSTGTVDQDQKVAEAGAAF
jgi:uncharacterized protein GlcG (DUF336 family)